MTTCRPARDRSSEPELNRLGSVTACVMPPVAWAALLLFGALPTSAPADAATRVCGDRAQILERLEQKHHETPQALGLSTDGGVLEVLVSPEGGWTILITYPKRPTCVVAVGDSWQSLTLVGQPA